MKMGEKNLVRRSVIGAVALFGVILLWRGIWETTEKLISSEVSLVIGVAILIIVGYFSRKTLMKRGIL